eukprot:Skav214821  [mRNA]  locus=scaffold1772:6545:7256:+ [translate_table: standard]
MTVGSIFGCSLSEPDTRPRGPVHDPQGEWATCRDMELAMDSQVIGGLQSRVMTLERELTEAKEAGHGEPQRLWRKRIACWSMPEPFGSPVLAVGDRCSCAQAVAMEQRDVAKAPSPEEWGAESVRHRGRSFVMKETSESW